MFLFLFLTSLLKTIRRNDTIIVESLSRISRNTVELLNLLEEFKKKEIHLISIKENFDFTGPVGSLLLSFLVAITQMEREVLLDRQREGIALAKLAGKYKGRKRIARPENFNDCMTMYLNRQNNYRIKNFMLDTGLKRTQLYSFIRQYNLEEKKAKEDKNVIQVEKE